MTDKREMVFAFTAVPKKAELGLVDGSGQYSWIDVTKHIRPDTPITFSRDVEVEDVTAIE